MTVSRRIGWAVAVAAVGAMMLAGPATAKQHEGKKGGEVKGLSTLMHGNRENLQTMVEVAYFAGVQKKLEAGDYGTIAEAAKNISANARTARENFSRGEKFDKFARKVEEHAGKAARAAAEGDHPEVNVEIGEIAEYCAGCHDSFRW